MMQQIQIAIKTAVAASTLFMMLLQPMAWALDSASLSLSKARALLSRSKDQQALACINALIGREPKNAQAYLCRADVYEQLGQYQKRLDDLTLAIKLKPDSADLLSRRAETYYELAQISDAIADCKKAISIDPSLAKSYFIAASAYQSLGMYKESLAAQTKLVELKPNRPFAWSDRALILNTLGRFDQSVRDSHKALALADPEDVLYMQLCSPLVDITANHPDNQLEPIRRQLKNEPLIWPLRIASDDYICVPAVINGHPLQLMLDTGCNHSDLWRQAMPGIGKFGGASLHETTPTGDALSSKFFKAREFKLGNLPLKNVALKVDDGLVGDKVMSGFLGGNILENFVVTIDYENKQVTLRAESRPKPLSKSVVVPMVVKGHQPFCKVTLNGTINVMAFLDTGSPENISADSTLGSCLTKKLTYSEHFSGPFLGSYDCESFRLKSITVGSPGGSATVENPSFDVFRASQAPTEAVTVTLGNRFLSNFKSVTFDYPGRKLIFEPK